MMLIPVSVTACYTHRIGSPVKFEASLSCLAVLLVVSHDPCGSSETYPETTACRVLYYPFCSRDITLIIITDLMLIFAGPSGHAVLGVGLRPLAC